MKPLLPCLVAALLAALPLWAQAAEPACRGDARRLCSQAAPGGGRLLPCLQQHEAELTPACKAALPTLAQCSADMKRLCGDGQPRDLRRCLQQHRSELAACAGLRG